LFQDLELVSPDLSDLRETALQRIAARKEAAAANTSAAPANSAASANSAAAATAATSAAGVRQKEKVDTAVGPATPARVSVPAPAA
jgi:hypothetical protein